MYLTILKDQCLRFGLAVDAYCLMTNHVHLVASVPSVLIIWAKPI
jgi:REP element-mobilizing transposase RayT